MGLHWLRFCCFNSINAIIAIIYSPFPVTGNSESEPHSFSVSFLLLATTKGGKDNTGVHVTKGMAEIKTSGRPIDQLLEKVLCMNILSSDYFRDLLRLKTYHEVIDEIYNQVDHVEPWMTGNCRGPSTAFCLLYKFFTMKLTVKQMHGLLKHPDSPYIRAVSGVLYLTLYLLDLLFS